MQTILIVVHLMVVVALVAVVLLQRSEGGALGIGGGGGGGFMTGRGQANALTRATAILATIFFITSIGLTLLANWGRAPTSVLDRIAPGQSVPAGGDLLDQLKRIDQQAPATPAAPAVPAAPQAPRPGQ
jgi:preprotein translocase subunit SecG